MKLSKHELETILYSLEGYIQGNDDLKLTVTKGQQLTKDLVEFVSTRPEELDWLCDGYVYSLNDKEVEELTEYINSKEEDDYQ